ncbi:hypothetical protein A2U01_0068735, partial [Trifolium medium]|nr:hypothetical protein [Trifolium medium]
VWWGFDCEVVGGVGDGSGGGSDTVEMAPVVVLLWRSLWVAVWWVLVSCRGGGGG